MVLKNLAIYYNEIYTKAMRDYINAIINGMTHVVICIQNSVHMFMSWTEYMETTYISYR